ECELSGELVYGVRILRDEVPGNRVDPVHPAAVLLVPHAGAKSELVLDDRPAHRERGDVAQTAAFGLREIPARKAAELGEARLVLDEPHRARLRAGAEQ